MASPNTTAAVSALFLILNLLFFSVASSCRTCRCNSGCNNTPSTPFNPSTPSTPNTPSAPNTPSTPSTPSTGSPSSNGRCPRDALKLGVCANVLGIININLGAPPRQPCCSLLSGLADLEAAVCLCTALRANILGINLNLPINLSLVLNYCGRNAPSGFQCS